MTSLDEHNVFISDGPMQCLLLLTVLSARPPAHGTG